MKSFNKKAEMSSTMLVTVILSIVGFGLALFLYYTVDWNNLSNDEVCHQSVVMRGSLPDTLGANSLVPLRCRTEKVCIRGGTLFGKGDCNQEFGNVKEKTTFSDVKSKEDVEKVIADNIANCYSMMGQGELSLFSQYWANTYGLGGVYSTCVVCSRMAFDLESLKKAGISEDNLTKINLGNYMMTHNVPNMNISYYEYLSKSKAGVGNLDFEIMAPDKSKIESLDEGVTGEDFSLENVPEEIISNPQLAVVFTQITAPDHGDVFWNHLGAAGSFFGIGVLKKPGAFISKQAITSPIKRNAAGQFVKSSGKKIVSRALTPFIKVLAVTAIVAEVATQVNIEYQKDFTAGYCGDVKLGNEARDGCSVVRLVNYDEEDISQYCSVIESIS